MVVSGEYGQISIEDLNNELWNIGGFPFLFFWFLDEKREDPIEGFEELFGIKDNFLGFLFGLRVLVLFLHCWRVFLFVLLFEWSLNVRFH